VSDHAPSPWWAVLLAELTAAGIGGHAIESLSHLPGWVGGLIGGAVVGVTLRLFGPTLDVLGNRIRHSLTPPAPAPVVAPAADLQSTLADSGLVMVETSAERAAGIEPVIVEQPQLGRRRRPAPVIADEPMQQVETRNE